MAIDTLDISFKGKLATRLHELGRRKQVSGERLVAEAVSQFLQREESSQFLLETDASWQEYKETGLHADNEDVMAWLDTWGTGAETQLPCLKK